MIEPQTIVTMGEASAAEVQAGLAGPQRTLRQLMVRKFLSHRLAVVSLVILTLLALSAIFASVISPHGFSETFVDTARARPFGKTLLGTDSLGRDQLTRLLYGGRVSLTVGVVTAIIATVVGTTVGSIAGFFGGRLDSILMRLTDTILALPALVVLIVASRALADRSDVIRVILVLSGVSWMVLARIVRGVVLSLKEKEFVEAARALGATNTRILVRHILPNALGPIIVSMTLTVAAAILLESTLSFLGYGISVPTPSWGGMLAESKGFARISPWLVWAPGVTIVVTAVCVNFVGDGLRDALDPTQRRK